MSLRARNKMIGVFVALTSHTLYGFLGRFAAPVILLRALSQMSRVRGILLASFAMSTLGHAGDHQWTLRLPRLGSEGRARELKLGGFSGLLYEGKSPQGADRFLTQTDRGPNREAYSKKGQSYRPFEIPDYAPEWVRLEVKKGETQGRVLERIPLKRDGKKISGLPWPWTPGFAEQEIPVDVDGHRLSSDPWGLDPEGLVKVAHDRYWMCDEYGPSLTEWDARGNLLQRIDDQSLPPAFLKRRLNKGFEGVASDGTRLWAVLEAPLEKKSRRVLILEWDLRTQTATGVYLYLLESNSKKIGEIVWNPWSKSLWVLEQNSSRGRKALRGVFEVFLGSGENLLTRKWNFTDSDIASARILRKELKLDLVERNYLFEKIEGMSFVDAHHLALINDNDFGVGDQDDARTVLGLFEIAIDL